MIEISDPVYFFAYVIAMCGGVRYMAQNKSYIGVKVPDNLRYMLLIFSFEEIKISIFAVLSQLYLYFMLVLFLVIKIVPAETVAEVINEPSTLLSRLALIHSVIIFPIGMIESSICEWQYRRHH